MLLRGCCLSLLVGLVGCGSYVRPRGEVTFDGKPLPQGTITFVTLGGKERPPYETRIVDGKFRFASRIPSGFYSVQINSWRDDKTNLIPKLYNENSLLAVKPDEDAENLVFRLVRNPVDGSGKP